MTDLRERIAAAGYNCYAAQFAEWDNVSKTCRNDWLAVADAVIRELGLTREQLGEDIGYPHPSHRYVTEWIADE